MNTVSIRSCVNTISLAMVVLGACQHAPARQPAPPPPIAAPQPVMTAAPPSQAVPAAPAVVDDGVAVAVDVRAEALVGEGPAAPIATGQRLKSGDRLAVYVTPNATAFVYAALVSTDGQPQLLFPTQGQGIVAAGVTERIPPAGKWFRLDKSTGREDIYVYAAKQPLRIEDISARARADAEADRKAAAREAKKPAAGKKAVKVPRHADNDGPGAVTSDTRSLELVEDTPPQAGVTKKRLSIRHGE